MKVNFEEYFTKEKAKELAKHIVDFMENSPEKGKIIEAEFDLSAGTMKKTSKPNTFIKFDGQENSIIKEIIEVLIDGENDNSEESIVVFQDFLDECKKHLENTYSKELKDKIRKAIFQDASDKIIPIKNLKIDFIEITDIPSVDCTIGVKRLKAQGDKSNMAKELMEDFQRTDYSNFKEFYEKDVKNNPKYKDMEIEAKKCFFECTVDINADYSFNQEILENVKKIVSSN